ncbi:hypothetical protein B0H12DRAFT_1143573, partial [Mycena haematopus]
MFVVAIALLYVLSTDAYKGLARVLSHTSTGPIALEDGTAVPEPVDAEALPPLHRRLLLRIPIRPERRCIDGPHSSAECRLRGD